MRFLPNILGAELVPIVASWGLRGNSTPFKKETAKAARPLLGALGLRGFGDSGILGCRVMVV